MRMGITDIHLRRSLHKESRQSGHLGGQDINMPEAVNVTIGSLLDVHFMFSW